MIHIFAYAKINLFLDIEKKREDGYHDIVSVMQTVDWCDKISLQKNHSDSIRILCSEPDIPADCRNTAYKAASLFLERIGSRSGIDISIEKNIPHAAGMAGGSADAAATLQGLNQLFDEPLCKAELLALGKKIGADVPFCMVGGTKLTRGIGEQISDFPPLPFCYVVCAKIGEGISTPMAYAELDRAHHDFMSYTPHIGNLNSLRLALAEKSLGGLTQSVYNIFEEIATKEHPAVAMLKEIFFKEGALVAMMSGSGPSVFGIFDDLTSAERACEIAKARGALGRVCVPVKDK